MKVHVVSIEWCVAPADATGDPGVAGVAASEDGAERLAGFTREAKDGDGLIVSGFTFRAGRFCQRRGLPNEAGHVCGARPPGMVYCDWCGTGRRRGRGCPTDHDVWDIDVHVTEHEVQP